MKALFLTVFLPLLLSVTLFCQSEVESCWQKIITSEPYHTNFTKMEQALLEAQVLASADGAGYRQLAQKMMDANDLMVLLPAQLELQPVRESYDCLFTDEDDESALIGKLLSAIDVAEQAPDLSPRFLAGTFLQHFDEKDWEQPLTRHLFFAYLAYHVSDLTGINIPLPPWSEGPDINRLKSRNVLSVLVDAENKLYVRGQELPLDQLREQVKLFIINPNADPELAELPTEAVIALKNDRGTSYAAYLEVYNELKGVYDELWDEYCRRRYGRPYDDSLPPGIRRQIRTVIPFNVVE